MKLTENEKAALVEYGHLICNTGGNDVAELLQRTDISLFSNAIAALLQTSCQSQLNLLVKLKEANLLVSVK